jgi:hypothetical protein
MMRKGPDRVLWLADDADYGAWMENIGVVVIVSRVVM